MIFGYSKCFIASRRLSGFNSFVSLTNFFTASGSVRAYCLSAQPMALLMKNSFDPKFSRMISHSRMKSVSLFVVQLEQNTCPPQPKILRFAPFGEIFLSDFGKPLEMDA